MKKFSLIRLFALWVLSVGIFVSAQASGIRVQEFLANPQAVSDASGEWIELVNTTNQSIDLQGWTIDDGGVEHSVSSSVLIPPLGEIVVCRNADKMTNGGVRCAYEWSSMSLTNTGDVITIRNTEDIISHTVTFDGSDVESGRSTIVDAQNNRTISENNPASARFGFDAQGDYATPAQNPRNGNSYYPTIQNAIDNAQASQTVSVPFDVFEEQIIIQKPIIIEGDIAGENQVGVGDNAPILDGSFLMGSVQNVAAITIADSIDQVEIKGFRIRDYNSVSLASEGRGISTKGNTQNTDIIIAHNVFENIKTDAVLIESTLSDSQAIIEYNEFQDVNRALHLVSVYATDIAHNVFSDLKTDSDGIALALICENDGIPERECNGNYVFENTFEGDMHIGFLIVAEGNIHSASFIDTLVIEDNTFQGDFVGISVESVQSEDKIDILNIKGNVFDIHDHYAIEFHESQGQLSNVLIQENKFIGNQNQGILSSANTSLDARFNWWGTSNGPSLFSDGIEYAPWFFNETMTTVTGMIKNITSSTANGLYSQGDSISVDIEFVHAVSISGSGISGTLNSGNTVSIDSVSNKNTISSSFIVSVNQSTDDLQLTDISLNTGSSITEDENGYPVEFRIPNGANIADNKDIQIDSVNPRFDSLSLTSNNIASPSYAGSNSVLTFSLVLETPDSFSQGNILFTIGEGEEQSLSFQEPASQQKKTTYTAVLDMSNYNGTSDGDTLLITGIEFQDSARNLIQSLPVLPSEPSPTVLIDNTKPVLHQVSYSTTNSNPNWAKEGDTIVYTLSFSEDVILENLSHPTVSHNASVRLKDITIPSYAIQDTLEFSVSNMDNGDIDFSDIEFTITDRAGNVSDVLTEVDVNTALSLWIQEGGNRIQADTIMPTITDMTIYSNNALNTNLAKTNDTITIDMTTNDNRSPTVSLVSEQSHILNRSITSQNLGSIGSNRTVHRMTDGTEDSQVIVPFAVQIQDEAGNQSLVQTTTNDGSMVQFDRTDPVFRNVSISSVSHDDSAYMGDVPVYYAKRGDTITLSFEARDYVGVFHPPIGTILGINAVFTQESDLGDGWYEWKGVVSSIDGDEGLVDIDVSVPDNAGNEVFITGTSDESAVIYDRTRPMLPTQVFDEEGVQTQSLKERSKALLHWNGDIDPQENGVDSISDIWKYLLLWTNPYPVSIPLSNNLPIDMDNEIHQGSENEPVEVIRENGRTFDGRRTQLSPWSESNELIPPRENSYQNNRYHPYRMRMVVVDKAGNYSCDETHTYCSEKGNLDWRGETLYEQPYSIGISGTVVDEKNEPLSGAIVQIIARYGEYCDGEREICTGITDENGEYQVLVNKDQDYTLIVYRDGYYSGKKDVRIQNTNGVYAEGLGNMTLQMIKNLKERQTQDRSVIVWLSSVFEEPTSQQKIQTYVQVWSLSGDIETQNIQGGIRITSQSRITGVASNNPDVLIQENNDNTFDIFGGGNVKNIKSGTGDGSKKTFSSGESRLGVEIVPASGKAGNRISGQTRKSNNPNEEWTMEDSYKEIEEHNKGVKGQTLSYINRNGYRIFGGYRSGRIPADGYKTKEDLQKTKEKIQTQRTDGRKPIGFRRAQPESAYKTVLTRKTYEASQKEREDVFARRAEERTIAQSRLKKNNDEVMIRGTNGKKVSMDVFTDPYMHRDRPKPSHIVSR